MTVREMYDHLGALVKYGCGNFRLLGMANCDFVEPSRPSLSTVSDDAVSEYGAVVSAGEQVVII